LAASNHVIELRKLKGTLATFKKEERQKKTLGEHATKGDMAVVKVRAVLAAEVWQRRKRKEVGREEKNRSMLRGVGRGEEETTKPGPGGGGKTMGNRW